MQLKIVHCSLILFFIMLELFHFINLDVAEPWQLYFQDPATPVAEAIIKLHDHIMFYLIIVVTLVLWMLIAIVYKFNENKNKFSHKYMTHGTALEIVWTITPAFILIAIAFPSFQLLYLMDEVIDPLITVKIVGHQWYWSYEYSDYTNEKGDNITFDSYMVPTDDLKLGDYRLLEVDERVVLPINTHIRLIMTGADVIHSWAVPSLGVKVDCIPGRLNQTSIYIKREGVFYGQCSELCGVQHGFMPIAVQGVTMDKYIAFLQGKMSDIVVA